MRDPRPRRPRDDVPRPQRDVLAARAARLADRRRPELQRAVPSRITNSSSSSEWQCGGDAGRARREALPVEPGRAERSRVASGAVSRRTRSSSTSSMLRMFAGRGSGSPYASGAAAPRRPRGRRRGPRPTASRAGSPASGAARRTRSGGACRTRGTRAPRGRRRRCARARRARWMTQSSGRISCTSPSCQASRSRRARRRPPRRRRASAAASAASGRDAHAVDPDTPRRPRRRAAATRRPSRPSPGACAATSSQCATPTGSPDLAPWPRRSRTSHPGLSVWRTERARWRDGLDWPGRRRPRRVADKVAVLDPIAPSDSDEAFWSQINVPAADRALSSSSQTMCETSTCSSAVRGRAFGPFLFWPGDVPRRPSCNRCCRDKLPGGLKALVRRPRPDGDAVYLPEQHALVFADAMTAPGANCWSGRRRGTRSALFPRSGPCWSCRSRSCSSRMASRCTQPAAFGEALERRLGGADWACADSTRVRDELAAVSRQGW